MTRVRWTPRARRLGRGAQTLAGGLFFAVLLAAVPLTAAVIR